MYMYMYGCSQIGLQNFCMQASSYKLQIGLTPDPCTSCLWCAYTRLQPLTCQIAACTLSERNTTAYDIGGKISVQVKSPPKAGAFKERPAKPTSFRKFYDRGDFPIALEHDTKGNKIAWKVCDICSYTGKYEISYYT